MKHLSIRIAVLTLVIAAGGTAADAQVRTLEMASDMIGMNVQNAQGRDIGSVVDLVLDRNLNFVTHAVLSQRVRGERTHYAVPFEELRMNQGRTAIILDADVTELRDVAAAPAPDAWFQGPLDVQQAPEAPGFREYARQPMIDIYGRPIEGRARTPYVQNVYEQGTEFPRARRPIDREEWRALERDQYGRPLYEREYYVGPDTFGHNGASVQQELYGRPGYRDPAFSPSRDDWRWGNGYGRLREPIRDPYVGRQPEMYDRFGRPIYDDDAGLYGRPLDRPGLDPWDRQLDRPGLDPYGRPLHRDEWETRRVGERGVDRYGRPLQREPVRDHRIDDRGIRQRRERGAWFQTDWMDEADRLGMRRVSNLIGTDVEARDLDAGNIEDLAIDMNHGNVAYMLISLTQDFAGASNRMAAVPWVAVDMLPEERFASIDIGRRDMMDLAFREGELPNLEDRTYARRLHEHYAVSPYWEVLDALGFVSPAEAEVTGAAWQAGSWYAQAFDPQNITTISGRIESISSFRPAPDAAAGLRLRVRTDDGRLLLVNAGPFNFVNEQGMTLSAGDRITVTGARADIVGQNVILASELRKDDQTVQLRTRQGQPTW